MGLKETMNTMRKLLAEINVDLEKSAGGNRAASQRVRVHTIDLEKVAKLYRKESVASERKSDGKPKKTAAKKVVVKKKK
jgi:hypothetical protein